MEADGSGSRRAAGPRGRRRLQTWLFALGIVGLLAGTVVGFVLARSTAAADADERTQVLADRAAAAIATQLQRELAAFAGADVVVGADGALDADRFVAFGTDVLDDGSLTGVALVGVVPDAERASFEATVGVPMTVIDADGDRVPAPAASLHYPVLFSLPEEGTSAVGLDFATDPARGPGARAASSTGEPVVSQVLTLARSGEPGLSLIRPVLDAAGTVRGFVVAGLPVARLQAAVDDAVGDDATAELLDGTAPVFGDDLDDVAGVRSAAVDVPTRDWRVRVDPDEGPDRSVAAFILVGGGLSVVAMLLLFVVTERHQRRLGRTNLRLSMAERRGRAIQELAGRLARALTFDEVADALLEQLPSAVGASGSALVTAPSAGGGLVGRRLLGGDEREPLEMAAPDPGSIVAGVLADEPAWLPSPLAWRDDRGVEQLAVPGAWAAALLPLKATGVRGVLAVSFPAVRRYSPEEQELLETVGALASRALARAAQHDAEHDAALTFQRSALPDALPAIDGLRVAARYRPAAQRVAVGGDWYDVLVLGERCVGLVVGDVVGHGMSAAVAMGRLRTATQAVASLQPDPAGLVSTITELATTIPDASCATMLYAVLDLEAQSLAWCRAGHPPPLLVLADGTTELLDDTPQLPLGVHDAGVPPVPVHTRPFGLGDTLVLYTDGVVERRGESLDDGLARLGHVAASLIDLDPDDLCDALVEAMVPLDAQADDIAVLVVRLAPPAG